MKLRDYPALAGALTMIAFLIGASIAVPPFVAALMWWWRIWLP